MEWRGEDGFSYLVGCSPKAIPPMPYNPPPPDTHTHLDSQAQKMGVKGCLSSGEMRVPRFPREVSLSPWEVRGPWAHPWERWNLNSHIRVVPLTDANNSRTLLFSQGWAGEMPTHPSSG